MSIVEYCGLWSVVDCGVLLEAGATYQGKSQEGFAGVLQEGGTAQELPRLPEGAIGLQAWQLEVGVPSPLDTDPCSFTAGPPWWRAP